MKKDWLAFYESLRHTSTLESIQKEFDSKAELLQESNSKLWQKVIIDEDDNGAITFPTYLSIQSGRAAKQILQGIEEEMDREPATEEKKQILRTYISEILAASEKIKNYYHLKKYAFLSVHLSNIVQNLTTFYLSPSTQHMDVVNSQIDSKPKAMTLRWVGGVASLGTLFRELSTKPFLNNSGPNLVATPKQIAAFLFEHFVDENDKQFSHDSLYTFVARSDKEAKRNKIPVDEILNEKKNKGS